MKVGVKKVKKVTRPELKKLNPGIKGESVPKFVIFGHFLQNCSSKVSNFCMMVEGNGAHYLRMVPYLGKILIWD